MRWLTRHPTDRELNRFADGELGEHELTRVSDHLARCPRCRGEIALVRRMGDSARSLPAPLATDEILRRALARRAAGDRVLLPNSDAGAPRRRSVTRFAPAAIAAMLTLMIASLVVSVRVLEADRPALRLYPERPAAGEALSVEYRGGSLFADQTHLKLRARFRTAEDRHWQLLAGILVRGDDGLYRTEVQLPDSVVYAAFAVEDLHGERLDSNNRELWEVMVHRDGQPTLDAMMARTWDLERRDWGEAYQQTLRMTEAYPDAPQSWAARFSYELSLFDRDSVFAEHSLQFKRLENAVSLEPSHDPKGMAWLGLYAAGLGDLESSNIWVRRASALAPRSEVVAKAEAMLISLRHADEPGAVLGEIEAIWSRLVHNSLAVANLGWQAAVADKDPDLTLLWLQRYFESRPQNDQVDLAQAYAIIEDRNGATLGNWIERFVLESGVSFGRDRPLHLPEDDYVRQSAALEQRVLAALAVAANRIGDADKARDFAKRAVDLAWEPGALLDIHSVLESAGESSSAAEILSRVAADPLTAEAAADRVHDGGNPAWAREVAEAKALLREHIMVDAVIRYINDDIRLVGPNGSVNLKELTDNQVSVVVFMSRYCAPALIQLPQIAQIARKIEAQGGRLFLVDIDSEPDMSEYLDRKGVPLPAYVDRFGDARSAFRSSSAPDYFVVDAAGRVRFEHSQLDEVLRQVEVLQTANSIEPITAD